MINDTICLQEFASLKSSESASTLYDDVQSIGSKSKVWHFYYTPKMYKTSKTDYNSHCLKITQNVAFEFLNFGISH